MNAKATASTTPYLFPDVEDVCTLAEDTVQLILKYCSFETMQCLHRKGLVSVDLIHLRHKVCMYGVLRTATVAENSYAKRTKSVSRELLLFPKSSRFAKFVVMCSWGTKYVSSRTAFVSKFAVEPATHEVNGKYRARRHMNKVYWLTANVCQWLQTIQLTLYQYTSYHNWNKFATLENDLSWIVQVAKGRVRKPHCGNCKEPQEKVGLHWYPAEGGNI